MTQGSSWAWWSALLWSALVHCAGEEDPTAPQEQEAPPRPDPSGRVGKGRQFSIAVVPVLCACTRLRRSRTCALQGRGAMTSGSEITSTIHAIFADCFALLPLQGRGGGKGAYDGGAQAH
jgi:hypothetical protein